MNKFFVFAVGILMLCATVVAEAGCAKKYDTRQGDDGRYYRVQVANPNCAATIGRTGDGVYNGRRKTGIGLGCLLGAGIAVAFGGKGGEVAGACIGGAQAGTYIGSTFDQDAQLRDQIDLNRSRCGAGTYYNTVSHQCEAEVGNVPQAQSTDESGQQSFRTVEEANDYCASLSVGGRFDAEAGACVAPRPVAQPVAQTTTAEVPTPQFCEQQAEQKGGLSTFVQRCGQYGRKFGPVQTKDGRVGCGCQAMQI